MNQKVTCIKVCRALSGYFGKSVTILRYALAHVFTANSDVSVTIYSTFFYILTFQRFTDEGGCIVNETSELL